MHFNNNNNNNNNNNVSVMPLWVGAKKRKSVSQDQILVKAVYVYFMLILKHAEQNGYYHMK